MQEKQDTTNEQFNVLANAEVVAVNSTPPADETQKATRFMRPIMVLLKKMKMGISRNISVIMMCHLLGQLMQKILRMRRSLQSTMLKRGSNYMVQIYNINAFNQSPLEDGRNMTPEELEARMVETNHSFSEKTVVTINGQEWQVGRQLLTDQN